MVVLIEITSNLLRKSALAHDRVADAGGACPPRQSCRLRRSPARPSGRLPCSRSSSALSRWWPVRGLKISWSDLPAMPDRHLARPAPHVRGTEPREAAPGAVRDPGGLISTAWLGAIMGVAVSISARHARRQRRRSAVAAHRAAGRVRGDPRRPRGDHPALILLTRAPGSPPSQVRSPSGGGPGIGTQGKSGLRDVSSRCRRALRKLFEPLAAAPRRGHALGAVAGRRRRSCRSRSTASSINIRTSAVLGLVGAGGIGSMLSNQHQLQAVGHRRDAVDRRRHRDDAVMRCRSRVTMRRPRSWKEPEPRVTWQGAADAPPSARIVSLRHHG